MYNREKLNLNNLIQEIGPIHCYNFLLLKSLRLLFFINVSWLVIPSRDFEYVNCRERLTLLAWGSSKSGSFFSSLVTTFV